MVLLFYNSWLYYYMFSLVKRRT